MTDRLSDETSPSSTISAPGFAANATVRRHPRNHRGPHQGRPQPAGGPRAQRRLALARRHLPAAPSSAATPARSASTPTTPSPCSSARSRSARASPVLDSRHRAPARAAHRDGPSRRSADARARSEPVAGSPGPSRRRDHRPDGADHAGAAERAVRRAVAVLDRARRRRGALSHRGHARPGDDARALDDAAGRLPAARRAPHAARQGVERARFGEAGDEGRSTAKPTRRGLGLRPAAPLPRSREPASRGRPAPSPRTRWRPVAAAVVPQQRRPVAPAPRRPPDCRASSSGEQPPAPRRIAVAAAPFAREDRKSRASRPKARCPVRLGRAAQAGVGTTGRRACCRRALEAGGRRDRAAGSRASRTPS